MSGTSPDYLLDLARRLSPGGCELAALVSPAPRIEAELVRAVRLSAAPHLDAGCEGDLWFGPLIASRGARAVTLDTGVAVKLREELALRWRAGGHERDRLKNAQAAMRRTHETISPALALEERVAWLVIAGKWGARIDDELWQAVSAVEDPARLGLAQWAVQAWTRLPAPAKRTRAGAILQDMAVQRLGRTGNAAESTAQAAASTGQGAVVPPIVSRAFDLTARVPLATAWTSIGIRLGDIHDDQAVEIMVPDLDPCRLEVTWRVNGVSSEPIEVELLLGQQLQLRRSGATSVEIVTEVGDVYELRRRSEPVPRPVAPTPSSPASRRERVVPDTADPVEPQTVARRQRPATPRAKAELEPGPRPALDRDTVGRAQSVARSGIGNPPSFPRASGSRPIILGVVGDSVSGATTLTKGLVRLLGEDVVTPINLRDYLRYDRKQRAERAITLLNPDCNYLDIMAAHLKDLHDGAPILKPVYQHKDGTFGPLVYVEPDPFVIVEGLLGFYTEQLRGVYDVRVYLDPPESLRRKWKVDRDCAKRGCTTDQVLDDLDRREPDSAAYIRPQRAHADIVVCRQPSVEDPFVLDAVVTLRDSLPHPDLSPFVDGEVLTMTEGPGGDRVLSIPGALERERAAEIEEAIWDSMHFASHLRSETLGEFTVGNDTHRSEPLALVQLLILYHLTMARATVVLGAEPGRLPQP